MFIYVYYLMQYLVNLKCALISPRYFKLWLLQNQIYCLILLQANDRILIILTMKWLSFIRLFFSNV